MIKNLNEKVYQQIIFEEKLSCSKGFHTQPPHMQQKLGKQGKAYSITIIPAIKRVQIECP